MNRIPVLVFQFQPKILHFLQGVSIACYAEPCISYSWDVCPSIRLLRSGTESKRHKLGSRNLQ